MGEQSVIHMEAEETADGIHMERKTEGNMRLQVLMVSEYIQELSHNLHRPPLDILTDILVIIDKTLQVPQLTINRGAIKKALEGIDGQKN